MKDNNIEQEKLQQICIMIPEGIFEDLHLQSNFSYRSISSIVRDIILAHYENQEVNND